jgi:uncharacterized coiled-coil protein SlyX
MKIYKYEILDGLSAQVQAKSSIAYCSQAILSSKDIDHQNQIIKKIEASANPKQIDLYYIKSVLVSTGWNKNDDVFSPEATWAARSTPEDKQFNFMHNENDIIGHITGSYVVDRDGNLLTAEQSETPSEFDIITEAVLYNSWTNPDNRQRMNNIIAEIEEGKWFVSMECLFAGFDYALISPDGSNKVIARNDDSSFLTKHLRAYGGTGEYEGYKIGRSLREISFSGKGLVSKPANPRSIILDSSKAFSINDSSSFIFNQGDKVMSENNTLEQQVEETPVVAEEKVETVSTDTTLADIANLQQSLSTVELANKELTEAVAEKEKAIEGLKDAIAAKEAEINDLKAAMYEMKKKEKMTMRKASLMEAGFEESEAEASLSLYDNLEDSAFDAIVAVYKKKMAKMTPKEDMTKEEKYESKDTKAEVVTSEAIAEEVTEQLFDGVKSTEATLVDASGDEDELNTTRASVAQWLTENVFHK